jgi:hypothetical protein
VEASPRVGPGGVDVGFPRGVESQRAGIGGIAFWGRTVVALCGCGPGRQKRTQSGHSRGFGTAREDDEAADC